MEQSAALTRLIEGMQRPTSTGKGSKRSPVPIPSRTPPVTVAESSQTDRDSGKDGSPAPIVERSTATAPTPADGRMVELIPKSKRTTVERSTGPDASGGLSQKDLCALYGINASNVVKKAETAGLEVREYISQVTGWQKRGDSLKAKWYPTEYAKTPPGQ